MVVVGPLDVRVLEGIAHLQHGHVLRAVSLLHVHVVAFALEGQDHVTVPKRPEGHAENTLLVMRLIMTDVTHLIRALSLPLAAARRKMRSSPTWKPRLNRVTVNSRCGRCESSMAAASGGRRRAAVSPPTSGRRELTGTSKHNEIRPKAETTSDCDWVR